MPSKLVYDKKCGSGNPPCHLSNIFIKKINFDTKKHTLDKSGIYLQEKAFQFGDPLRFNVNLLKVFRNIPRKRLKALKSAVCLIHLPITRYWKSRFNCVDWSSNGA